MLAILILLGVIYAVMVMFGLLEKCIQDIPGAQDDPKLKKLLEKFKISGLFLPREQNGNYNSMRGNHIPYLGNRYQDPFWTGWSNDEL